MKWCLRTKLAQNWMAFGDILLATGDHPIVEDSRKDDYWGAKTADDDTLTGKNVLGRLVMELREKLKRNPEDLKIVAPPPLADFRLLGEAIPTIVTDVSERSSHATTEARQPVIPGFWDVPSQP